MIFKIREKETGKVLTDDDLVNGLYLISDIHISIYGNVLVVSENEDENGELVSNIIDVSDRYEVINRSSED